MANLCVFADYTRTCYARRRRYTSALGYPNIIALCLVNTAFKPFAEFLYKIAYFGKNFKRKLRTLKKRGKQHTVKLE